jgi:hypothetical protein
MTDKETRATLRTWPMKPNKLWDVPGTSPRWLRAWPKRTDDDRIKSVILGPPGATAYRTRPDGLWISSAKEGLADVFVVEQSGKMQNLHDKRSRYGASTSSIIAFCPSEWLEERLTATTTRRQYLGLGGIPTEDAALPVRHLRVLYVVPDADYARWATNCAPGGHEFFCRYSSLKSYRSQEMQRFLQSMSPARQFYTDA